jgi:uncharacterized protein YecT (DUF1311 family)
MNRAEAARLTELEVQLDRVIATIRSALTKSDDSMKALNLSDIDASWLSCFDKVQARWIEFRNADCDFITHLNRGGTIRPLLWASHACTLTEDRIAALEDWIKVESNRLTIFDSGPNEAGEAI